MRLAAERALVNHAAAAGGPVAFDASSSASTYTTGSSLSWSHTNAGSILIVGAWGNVASTSGISAVTFNSVALTKLASKQTPGDRCVDLWYLVNPAVGTYTIAITTSASATYGWASSYLHGASIEASNTTSWTNQLVGSDSITTLSANAMPVLVGKWYASSGSPTISIDQGTARVNSSSATAAFLVDDGSAVSTPGSVTLSMQATSVVSWGLVMASIAT